MPAYVDTRTVCVCVRVNTRRDRLDKCVCRQSVTFLNDAIVDTHVCMHAYEEKCFLCVTFFFAFGVRTDMRYQ